jgi:hypothetical protein
MRLLRREPLRSLHPGRAKSLARLARRAFFLQPEQQSPSAAEQIDIPERAVLSLVVWPGTREQILGEDSAKKFSRYRAIDLPFADGAVR